MNFHALVLESVSGTCASVRLDSLISLAFKTSRSSMVSYIEGGQVFVNGKLITSNGYEPKDGDIISSTWERTVHFLTVFLTRQKKDAAVCVLCAMYKFCNKRRTGKWQNRNYL